MRSKRAKSIIFAWVFLYRMFLVILFICCLVIVGIHCNFIMVIFDIATYILCLLIMYLLFRVVEGVSKNLFRIIFFEYCPRFDLIFIDINFIIYSFQSFIHL